MRVLKEKLTGLQSVNLRYAIHRLTLVVASVENLNWDDLSEIEGVIYDMQKIIYRKEKKRGKH